MPMASRRDRFDPADAADLHPEQRQREVAAIPAAGLILMLVRRGSGASSRRPTACMSQIPSKSGETRLELSDRSTPDGQRV